MKIFDFHTHLGYDYHDEKRGYHMTPDRYVRELSEMGVSLAAGSTIRRADSRRPLEDYEEIIPRLNAEAYEMHEAYPDFFVPGIHVHPAFVELSLAQIEKYAAKGVKLLGELVPYMMQYNALAVPEADAIWEAAVKHNMVVSVHPTTYPDLDAFAKRHRDLRIVVAHLGVAAYDDQLDLFRKNENIWFDVSGHADERENFVRDAIDAIGKDRILYGSDFPAYLGDRFIKAVLKDCKTDAELEAILWNNAYGLLFG